IANDYTTTATIITPVYNEDPVLFRRALDSWIANGPDRIITVVDVTDIRCMEIARGYPGVEVIPIDIPGKRPALAAGVVASRTATAPGTNSTRRSTRPSTRSSRASSSSASVGAVTASAATCARSGRAGSGATPTWRLC